MCKALNVRLIDIVVNPKHQIIRLYILVQSIILFKIERKKMTIIIITNKKTLKQRDKSRDYRQRKRGRRKKKIATHNINNNLTFMLTPFRFC